MPLQVFNEKDSNGNDITKGTSDNAPPVSTFIKVTRIVLYPDSISNMILPAPSGNLIHRSFQAKR